MKKPKDIIKDALPNHDSEPETTRFQELKAENEAIQNHIEQLEEKMEILIGSEAVTGKGKKMKYADSTDIKQSTDASAPSVLLEKRNAPRIQRLSVFGLLKVKLIRWTLLTVDITDLNIDFKRVD